MLRARAALLAAVLAVAPAARAAEREPLRYDLRVDVPVTATAGTLWIVSELLKAELAPASCRVCGTNRLDEAARDALLWDDAATARHASDAVAFGLIPAAAAANALLAAGGERDGWVDLLVVVQAATIAADLNQLAKFAVGRERPFVHFGNYPADPARADDPDDDLSFFSGHTTLAFALAAASGTVSSMRGDRSAPWVWGAGVTLAATVGYLRIAGDMHYLTDVLTGAAVGTAVGVGVPWLLHRPRGGSGSSEGGVVRQGEVAVFPLVGGVLVVF